ncbi:VOC family protein [Aquipuribacter sp. MA13-6]|uniref:VOC family protein n=1 Tax=unclassified Aquipuribacter TaxID=2635084 RepID=UPI003EE8B1E2
MSYGAGPLQELAWVDLTTPDLDKAESFYSALLGWDLESTDTPMGRYVVGSVAAGPVGGMMAPPPGQAAEPSAWAVFFAVPDATEAYASALRLGATALQPPMEVPGGVIAVVTDPAGAAVGLMESAGGAPTVQGTAGAVAWVESQSRDLPASLAFYQHLGWSPGPVTDGYHVLEHDGAQVAGLMAMPDEVPAEVPSYWAAYFAVTDLDRACTRVEELGGSVVVPAMTVETMRFAFVTDPCGAAFALLQAAG